MADQFGAATPTVEITLVIGRQHGLHQLGPDKKVLKYQRSQDIRNYARVKDGRGLTTHYRIVRLPLQQRENNVNAQRYLGNMGLTMTMVTPIFLIYSSIAYQNRYSLLRYEYV